MMEAVAAAVAATQAPPSIAVLLALTLRSSCFRFRAFTVEKGGGLPAAEDHSERILNGEVIGVDCPLRRGAAAAGASENAHGRCNAVRHRHVLRCPRR